MTPSSKYVIPLLATAAALIAAPSLSAQDVTFKKIGNRTIACGCYKGPDQLCVSRGEYPAVFAGRVLSLRPVKVGGETEQQIDVLPQEVFRGNVAGAGAITVTTWNWECMPTIKPGDTWLFHLEEKDGHYTFSLCSPSKPLSEASTDLEMLRRLDKLSGSGLIVGVVVVGETTEAQSRPPAPNQTVTATQLTSGEHYEATSDAIGHFEFPPLPAGTYNLTFTPGTEFVSKDNQVEVKARQCFDQSFELEPDGHISGRVTRADGHPASGVTVTAFYRFGFANAWTDKQGFFELTALRPGRYVIGVNLHSPPPPEMMEKSGAIVITLAPSERHGDVNFFLPRD